MTKPSTLLKRLLVFFSLFNLSLAYLFAQGISSHQGDLEHHATPSELIIRIRPETSQEALHTLTQTVAAASISPVLPQLPTDHNSPLSRTYVVRFPHGRKLDSILREYKTNQWIEAVEPNYLSRPLRESILPTDPRFAEQWGLRNINMPEAWAIEQGDSNVVIAVVDSGIDLNHEDLRSRIWRNQREIANNGIDDDENGYVDDVNGWDFSDAPTLPGRGDYIERDNEPHDETGHGTHVSGIIGAAGNNDVGVAGIAWGCRIMPLRAGFVVASGGAFLQNDDVAAAIVYAADNGAKIINMSWGDTVNAFVVHDAVEYAYQRGCVLIASAGNSHRAGALYPAALKTVIAVGATAADNRLAFVSNFGASIDIAAPGDAILSTQLDSTYGILSGTSMAAPHVSGVAALLQSRHPEFSHEDVRRILIATARSTRDDRLVGAGIIDAEGALNATGNLTAKISTPQNFGAGDKVVDIVGTASGTGFAAYRLEFGETEIPDRWFPIGELEQDAKFRTILGRWDTSSHEEGVYTVRLSVLGENQMTARDRVVLEIDHSPPEVSDHHASLWLSRDRFASVITWRTDDVTTGKIEFRRAGSEAEFDRLHTEAASRQHTLALPLPGLLPGDYEYRLTVQNRAGSLSVDDNIGKLHRLQVTDRRITPHRLQMREGDLPALHIATATADFNGNGKSELVAMEIGGAGYAPTQIFELDNSGAYHSVFSTAEAFLPWAIGDTDGDGLIEVLGSQNERTFLIEQNAPSEFPTEQTWAVDGIWGGQIVDVDEDGQPEIVSRHNATNAIWIHETVGDDRYRRTAVLPNPTEGDNGIGTTFAIGDFDGDGRTEIMAGDKDGDLFIYEVIGDNEYFRTWIAELDTGGAQLLAAGDLDGDGVSEFVVGAKSGADAFDLPVQHWIFTIFKSAGDNRYEPIWTQRIREARSGGNGLTIGDADSDGRNELAISVWPNFYLIQYDGVDYVPVWHHSASSTFRPIVADVEGDGQNELMFNNADALAIFGAPTSFVSAQPPWALTAYPIDETSVWLKWQVEPSRINLDAVTYVVYRGISADSLGLVRDGVKEAHFTDEGLNAGQTYWYAVAETDSTGAVSNRSQSVAVTPTSPPRLISAKYLEPNRLQLNFDKRMNSSAAQPSHYRLREGGSGALHLPQSALLHHSGQRVIATFSSGVLRPLKRYKIRVTEVRDVNGALLAIDANTLTLTVPELAQPTDLSGAVVYPNPADINRVVFDGLPLDTEISVYDIVGNLVASLAVGPTDRGRKIWSLRQANRPVSSGVYIYLLEAGDDRRTGKLSIIR